MMRDDWVETELGRVSILNPKIKNKDAIDDNLEVQFIPMKLVDELVDKIHLTEIRKFHEVQKKVTHILRKVMFFLLKLPLVWRMEKSR